MNSDDDDDCGLGRWIKAHCPFTQACKRCPHPCLRCGTHLRRQPKDARDQRWTPTKKVLGPNLPHQVSLGMPPVLDQKTIGACAVNACANTLNFLRAQRGHVDCRVSRMFLYYNVRRHVMKVTDLEEDTGCNLRDACKATAKFGACDEALWPYVKKKLHVEPPAHLYHHAKRSPQCKYMRVPQTLPHIVSCLLHGNPIVAGITIFSNIHDVKNDGRLDMPREGDGVLGGHGVIVCGYDMNARRFRLQNCWGSSWGDRGFFTVPFDFILSNDTCWDLWTFVLREASE